MQIHCPNCNGYKSHKIGSYFLEPITLKRLRLFQPLGCLIPIVIALFGGIVLWSNISPSAVDQSTTSQSSGPAFAIAFGIALIVWLLILAFRRNKLVNIALHVTQYECDICGKQFTQTVQPRSPQLAMKRAMKRRKARSGWPTLTK